PPGPNAGEGGGISHDVSRRLVPSSSGRHLDRVLGGPPSALNVAIVFGGSSTFRFNTSGPFSLLEFLATIVDIVSLAVVTLALSSVVWTYWSISKGMRRFSEAPLELRPYYEDPFLGLKPVGSLALSLATVYFGFIALFLLAVLTSPSTP